MSTENNLQTLYENSVKILYSLPIKSFTLISDKAAKSLADKKVARSYVNMLKSKDLDPLWSSPL